MAFLVVLQKWSSHTLSEKSSAGSWDQKPSKVAVSSSMTGHSYWQLAEP